MEARKITIVSTKTQKKSVIMSEAETLRDLKRDLAAANIEYDDMTFFEGTSKTELVSDDSVLPKDVPYTNRTTGETKVTNELVFLLTNTNKKIKSGADSMTRFEAYAAIKANNLQAECVRRYGKNFTTCSTQDLINLINATTNNCKCRHSGEVVTSTVDTGARAAIRAIVSHMYNNGMATGVECDLILADLMESTDSQKVEMTSPYNDSEIDNMFMDML